MYLHIGNNKLVRNKNLLGIFDLDTATIAPATKKYLAASEIAGRLEAVDTEIPKSSVVTVKRRTYKQNDQPLSGTKVYLTQISTAALKNRSVKKELTVNI